MGIRLRRYLRILAAASLVGQCAQAPAQESGAAPARELSVTVGKSLVMDSPVNIQRVSVANGQLAEAVAVSPREILVNGKAPGETTLIIWQQGGSRLLFDLTVRPNGTRLQSIQRQLDQELGGQKATLNAEDGSIFLRGTVKDLVTAERALTIASALGKVVNLLRVDVPPAETQILLKVKFADVDRAASTELGVNFFSTGALNTLGATTTGEFTPPRFSGDPTGGSTVNLSDVLNIFLFRTDLNLGATIRALQNKRVLQILAEPNVLALNGKQAYFLSGGEFPYPTLQGGGAGIGQVTIQFREFGIRINFTPTITPRGTIWLKVNPEVSALDYANSLTFQGFTIPGLSTRRVQTEIELESGQSFGIAGLLDNRTRESLSKIPGLGDIPLLGKLFQSRSVTKSNTELLVLVTPEVVHPIPADRPAPELKMPVKFLDGAPQVVPRTPGMSETGPVPVKSAKDAMPVEQLIQTQKETQALPAPTAPTIQYVPVPVQPAPAAPAAPPTNPGGPGGVR